MKSAQDILYGIALESVHGSTRIDISGITLDSRNVEPSFVYVATKGVKNDGHDFINASINKGANLIIVEDLPSEFKEGVTYIQVKDSRKAIAVMAANFYDHPSKELKLVGVTGTNGKTTVATMLYKVYRNAGENVGLLSTIKNLINEEVYPSTHTTGDAVSINALLRKMVSEGCTYAFMEVSSHAADQDRIWGLHFEGGIFTNLSHDHLDYHKTFKDYIFAKKKFFDQLPAGSFAVVNIDDKRGEVMLQNTKAKAYSYALRSIADFRCKILENTFGGLVLQIDGAEVYTRMVGKFNAYNLLAVYAAATLLGMDKMEALSHISLLEGATGRFDWKKSADGIIGIVDYAHTPDAVKNVLDTIRDIRTGNENVITVIGCGGERDAEKRPVMALIAAELSDKVILTSDNPRSEDPLVILDEMKAGVPPQHYKKVLVQPDRREAIRTAVSLANKGDIILLAGKGHEDYQEIKGIKYPFDDKAILQETFTEMAR